MNNILAMKRIRQAMTALSFLLVLYTAGVMLAGSLHIVESGESSSFLQSIPHAPSSPWMVFWLSFILCSLLSWLILNTVQGSKSGILLCAGFKTLLACIIIWNVNLSCRPLLLLVFSDVLYTMRGFQARYMVGIGSILTGLYLLFSYEVITPMIPMVSTGAYFSVFEHSTASLLAFGQSLLESATLVLFIAFMCEFLIDLHQEKENIAQELNMMNRVNEDLRHYAQMTEQIAESRERKRLAREIHDTLGHALTGIAAGIDATLVIMDKNPEMAKSQLHLVRQVVSEGIGDVRASLQKLRPGALEQRGLKGALEKMIREFESVTAMTIDLDYQADSLDVDKAKEDVCFRLVQESITNARRHGAATHAAVRFAVDGDWLVITVRDNGRGLPQKTITYGYGLTQMEENVSSLHGTLLFDGSDGFLTEARIPLTKGEYRE
ncbi:sensor histidine kinase [Faecalibaculum rodentium]|uniref:sensor histidine kinase n=1 Tax=Faecalibaculum rodentium TaxID=1702221 RepID=UPI0023F10A16|nr:sensor histidine kinase [Faecalibaculum rodentium]